MFDVSAAIEEHKRTIKRKTMTPKELAEEYGIGITKVYELVHVKSFPVIWNGNRALIIRSKVDEWIENNLGLIF